MEKDRSERRKGQIITKKKDMSIKNVTNESNRVVNKTVRQTT